MFTDDVFAVDGPNGTRAVGSKLHMPDADDPELAFYTVGDERFRYLAPHAAPNVGDNRVDFDTSVGHWQLRPLRDGDRSWALQPNWDVPGDLEAFRDWARWRAGLIPEPAVIAVYTPPTTVNAS